MKDEPLQDRFARALQRLDLVSRPAHVLVAVSGGCDSVVLLHLFRTAARTLPLTITAAHLDHGMRPDSQADALWVSGLCAAWGIPLLHERLAEPPRSEGRARSARYEFLHRMATEAGADFISTGHTADDQAETVLFRAARGTGLRGLAGIRARTRSGVVRPMLRFWRAEVHRYAREAGLRWRSDATNTDLRYARNRIRRHILPELERTFAPAARRRLVSLAAEAAAADTALERLAHSALDEVARPDGDAWLVDRLRLQGYDPAVATRILRSVLRRLGPLPGRAGTRAALQFITDAASGREMQLAGGLRIRTEFREARIELGPRSEGDLTLELGPEDAGGGWRTLRVGGVRYRAALCSDAPADESEGSWTVELDEASTRFPLQLRGRRPGDRVTTSGGTKSLKKLFLEDRIPRSRRAALPVLADATGRVLWVAGVRRDLLTSPAERGPTLFLTITND